MAEKKKVEKKKAEAPKPKSSHELVWELFGFFFALAVLATMFSSFSLPNFFKANSSSSPTERNTKLGNTNTNSEPKTIEGDFGFWQNIFDQSNVGAFPGAGNIIVSKKVINERLVQVRKEPGGGIIGLQPRGEEGVVLDGPAEAYGERWWRLNYDYIPSGWVSEKDITTNYFLYYVVNFIPISFDYIKIIGWVLSGFFALVIAYVVIMEVNVPLYDESPESVSRELANDSPIKKESSLANSEFAEPPEENVRWKHVEALMSSHNQNDWRQAIIEADVMLENMLDKMGYPGVSIGDKLKNIEESDFETLDKAWEAHKVRNMIAHDGSEYKLSYDEARRVVGLYYDVFKEFYWV